MAYVGSQSEVDVFFDDVQLEHRPDLQVQEAQYDPAGLELAGLAPSSPGIRGLNNYRFNGKEFQADLGLAWNHQDWRFFDPQILRWHVGDPEIENGQESWTPYSFGFDNAIRYNDPNGRCPCENGVDFDAVNRAVLGLGISLFNLAAKGYASATGANEKWVASYETNEQGTAYDYAYHKEPIGTAGQEAKAVALDASNVASAFAIPAEGRLFEQAGGKVIVNEAVQEVKSAGKITGYTAHGANQAISRNGGRGVDIQNMLDAVSNPKKIKSNPTGTTSYTGKRGTTVVLNEEGKVVTAFGKNRGPKVWAEPRSIKPNRDMAPGGGAAQRRAIRKTGDNYNPKLIR